MNDGWDGILDADERILWQGRPDGDLVLDPANLVSLIFGLFFAGFALFWMVMAAQGGGAFWMFGLLHFCVGLLIALGPIFGGAFIRRRTWYTLTDRRAFVATKLPVKGKTLDSYPIDSDTRISFDDTTLSTIHFAHGRRYVGAHRRIGPIGFERIADGREVYRMIRDIQKNTRDHA
ncbi:aspartate carbamoyltransferase catalytic subunit [Shimia sp. SDUM112013]|uniref:aspartate carbamoyltransferase catalytic subunit n=1 Tax=Shimia sp. SDUM112013 TaxID=3136160 RepID=UPI0032EE096E